MVGESGIFGAANKSVVTAQCGKRKRGPYFHYDAKVHFKIAKYASENGNKCAVNKFSAEQGHAVSEATVRNFKLKYISLVKAWGLS